MEIKIPIRGESKTSNEAMKQSISRLRKRASMSLQLDAKKKSGFAWEDDAGGAFAPIPLLSPLALSPTPFWDAKNSVSEREDGSGDCDVNVKAAFLPSPPEGWRHPALQVAVMEPVALVPFFEFQ